MESQKVPPVTGAGFDPAYVPGLTSPGAEAVAEDVKDTVTEPDETTEEVTREEPQDAKPEPEPAPAADVDGPAMEAKDRRGSITVDATGVRFTLDDQEADFTWDEISAVEYGTSRKRLTVTVHTPNSRWYPNDVEAPDKARLAEWTDQLDKALDAYFED
ncbi:hypothetical protein ACIRF8_22230 [Streptomyces sp. NPDC102406]|uniref:hypothetical protein n=1 Tax=Streptomyces sp. NPDC102406 TaxID=3366171 RepID=UPI00381292F8